MNYRKIYDCWKLYQEGNLNEFREEPPDDDMIEELSQLTPGTIIEFNPETVDGYLDDITMMYDLPGILETFAEQNLENRTKAVIAKEFSKRGIPKDKIYGIVMNWNAIKVFDLDELKKIRVKFWYKQFTPKGVPSEHEMSIYATSIPASSLYQQFDLVNNSIIIGAVNFLNKNVA